MICRENLLHPACLDKQASTLVQNNLPKGESKVAEVRCDGVKAGERGTFKRAPRRPPAYTHRTCYKNLYISGYVDARRVKLGRRRRRRRQWRARVDYKPRRNAPREDSSAFNVRECVGAARLKCKTVSRSIEEHLDQHSVESYLTLGGFGGGGCPSENFTLFCLFVCFLRSW